VLCLDQTKQYYFTMTDDELTKSKWAEPGRYVCSHPRTLLSNVTTESCSVTLLHKRDSLLPECDTRLIKLSSTVWTQLSNNSWIFYAPHPDIMTIVCHDYSRIDIPLKGIGKLHVQPGCKGYSTNNFFYGSSVVSNVSMLLTFFPRLTLKMFVVKNYGLR
jgi:hypothetical protein